ncbi:hypothetical protein HaLaN_05790, partial [Haematococcus lacustris]
MRQQQCSWPTLCHMVSLALHPTDARNVHACEAKVTQHLHDDPDMGLSRAAGQLDDAHNISEYG